MIQVSELLLINIILVIGTVITVYMGTWAYYEFKERGIQIVIYLTASIIPITGLFLNGVIVIVD